MLYSYAKMMEVKLAACSNEIAGKKYMLRGSWPFLRKFLWLDKFNKELRLQHHLKTCT
jgi:hypothetical protein